MTRGDKDDEIFHDGFFFLDFNIACSRKLSLGHLFMAKGRESMWPAMLLIGSHALIKKLS